MSNVPADLNRRLQTRLWIVAAVFGLALSLTLWMGAREADVRRDAQLQQQIHQAEKNVLRRLDFYRQAARQLADEPDTHDLIVLGDPDSQQNWAQTRFHFIPGVIGLALVGPDGQVLGNAGELRVGPACTRDLRAPGVIGSPRLLVHRAPKAPAHFDMTVPVKGVGGDVVGGVFLSLGFDQLQRVIDDSQTPGHALAVVDRAGRVVVQTANWRPDAVDLERPLHDTGWRIQAKGPAPALSNEEKTLIVAMALSLLAVLAVMLEGMRTLRRNMNRDLAMIRDGLEAVAVGAPLPPLLPTYRQFQPAMREIEHIAGEIEKQRSELARLSLTDGLTGLPNRRALEGRFELMLGFAQRGHPIALALLDLDRFKALNDAQGHASGDRALGALARAMSAVSRRTDFYVRLAGDEFVAVLAGLDAQGAAIWYQRLTACFQEELRAAGVDAELGISAGYTWLAGEDDLSRALGRADRALYRAKAEGRARLVVYADSGEQRAR
ncbi:MAG: GGDEF domain-containing protein [Thiobacillus sp.]|nr:GGDEF domain-containing protein [Thiobacillus sp.]